jgi:hypothetical protein
MNVPTMSPGVGSQLVRRRVRQLAITLEHLLGHRERIEHDAHSFQPGQVDHQAAIARSVARDVVPASAECHEEIVRPSEVRRIS